MLYGHVPEERLRECFVIAYREKKEGSIFEANNISQVWYRQKAMETKTSSTCTFCNDYMKDSSAGPCPFHMKHLGSLTPSGEDVLPQ